MTEIFLRPSARTPVQERRNTTATAGRGLDGDHAGGGARQVTLISREGWEAACAEIGRPELSPGARRANLVVEGVDLARSIGGGLRVGECLLRIVGETRPCRLMDDAAPGLQKALEPETRGGVYGRVVVGGKIEVGDAVVVVAPGADELEGPQRSLPLSKRAAQGGAAE